MRFRGGGVGHTSTRAATNSFLSDCDCLDLRTSGDEHKDDFDEEYTRGVDEEVLEDEQEDWLDIEENGDKLEDGSDLESEEGNGDDEEELADDALGPDDGEVDDDEVAGLGFAAF